MVNGNDYQEVSEEHAQEIVEEYNESADCPEGEQAEYLDDVPDDYVFRWIESYMECGADDYRLEEFLERKMMEKAKIDDMVNERPDPKEVEEDVTAN